MSWKEQFEQGVKAFRSSNLDEAYEHFTKAIELGGTQYTLYDSRAAVLERLERTKDALKDAKATIDASPTQWQGYARSSRLFLKLHKYSAAVTMADLALERLKERDTKRAEELLDVKQKAQAAQEALVLVKEKQLAATFYHFGKLPVEIIANIFVIATEDDSAGVITISHVCQHWRGITLQTAALWSTLVLSRRSPIKKAMLWNARAGGMVKELMVRRDFEDRDQLISKKPLWKNLRKFKTASSYLSIRHILSLLDHDDQVRLMQNIEDVTLESCDTGSLATFSMPALRHLEIQLTPFPWIEASAQISSLRTLVARDMDFSLMDVLTFLQSNTMLETISLMSRIGGIELIDLTTDDSDFFHPLSFPYLRSLELANFGMWSDMLIVVLSMPALESLTLTALRCRQDVGLQTLLVQGGFQHLKELKIHKCSVAPSTLIKILRVTSALETLELTHIGGDTSARGDINEVIETLAGDPRTQPETRGPLETQVPFCPSLQYLDVSHCPGIKTGPLIRLVKTHLLTTVNTPASLQVSIPEVRPLHRLVMDGCPLIEAEVLPWLRSKVPVVSCVYMTKEVAKYKR